MNNEEWRAVVGWEGKFEVSSCGRVRKILPCGRRELRKLYKHSKGYLSVFFETKRKDSVHRVVARAFIPNPNQKPQVNHINAVKDDNRVVNLEWVTEEENRKHAQSLRLYRAPFNPAVGERSGKARLNDENVRQIRLKYKRGASGTELAREYGVANATVYSVIKRESWKHIVELA